MTRYIITGKTEYYKCGRGHKVHIFVDDRCLCGSYAINATKIMYSTKDTDIKLLCKECYNKSIDKKKEKPIPLSDNLTMLRIWRRFEDKIDEFKNKLTYTDFQNLDGTIYTLKNMTFEWINAKLKSKELIPPHDKKGGLKNE